MLTLRVTPTRDGYGITGSVLPKETQANGYVTGQAVPVDGGMVRALFGVRAAGCRFAEVG